MHRLHRRRRDELGARAARQPGARRRADGLHAQRLLAADGHAARQDAARGAVAVGPRAVEAGAERDLELRPRRQVDVLGCRRRVVLARPARAAHRPHRLQGRVARALAAPARRRGHRARAGRRRSRACTQLAGLEATIGEPHRRPARRRRGRAHASRAARPQVVFHLAAQALVRASYREPLATFATNIDGHGAPARSAARAGRRARRRRHRHHRQGATRTASGSIRYREDDALGGHDPYSASKACAELVAASYRSAFLAATPRHRRSRPRAPATSSAAATGAEDRLVPDAGPRLADAARRCDVRRAERGPAVAARAGAARRLPAPGRASGRDAGAAARAPGTSARAPTRTRERRRRRSRLARARLGAASGATETSGAPHEARPARARQSRRRATSLGVAPRWPLTRRSADDALVPALSRGRLGGALCADRPRRPRARAARHRRLAAGAVGDGDMSRLQIEDTPLAGLRRVRRLPLGDARGFLARLFCADELRRGRLERADRAGQPHADARSAARVRGLHFQRPPHAETKLVHCLRGEVCDVAVDLRRGSPTFLRWHAEALSGDNGVSAAHPAKASRTASRRSPTTVDMLYLPLGAYAAGRRGRPASARPAPGDRLAAADRRRSRRATTRTPSLGADFAGVARMKCRHCAAELDARLPRPRQRAAVERLPERSGAARARGLVSAAPARLRALLAGADRGPRRPRGAVQRRLRVLQLVLVVVARPRRSATSTAMRRALRPRHATSLVCEVAANDGYLLQLRPRRRHPVLRRRADGKHRRGGARARARDRRATSSASRSRASSPSGGRQVDLVAANNVLAHVPDINDFVARLRAAAQARRRRDLRVPAPAAAGAREPVRHRLPRALLVPVARHRRAGVRRPAASRCSTSRTLPTHGGSLRVFAQRRDTARRARGDAVAACCGDEAAAGMRDRRRLRGFQARTDKLKDDFVAFLIEARRAGRNGRRATAPPPRATR